MSHFTNALAEAASLTNEGMDRLLPLADGLEVQVLEAMRYSCLAGGKRLRPFLVLASADLFSVSRECSERVAVAVEMIHTYSLIHDDLPAMDDDDLRRGKPTCHRKFDEATAILAGDGLISLAFEILEDPTTNPDELTRSLSVPSVVTLKCPSDPVSTTSASVFPSAILSDAIVLQVGALPEPPLVNT